MEFSVLERYYLLELLKPLEGDLLTMRVVRDLIRDLGFTADELGMLNIQSEGNITRWDPEASLIVKGHAEISPAAQKIILSAFKPLLDGGKLNLQTLALYERFEPAQETV